MSEDDRQIRWGILSTARIATKVCRAIPRAAGAEAVAVASREGERARRWAAEHGVPRDAGENTPAAPECRRGGQPGLPAPAAGPRG